MNTTITTTNQSSLGPEVTGPEFIARNDTQLRKLVFLSSCPEPWGGSEELWSGAALRLAGEGHALYVVKTLIDREEPKLKSLSSQCRMVEDYYDHYDIPRYIRLLRRIMPWKWLPPLGDRGFLWLCRTLRSLKPNLAVVSQGENFDGLFFVKACHEAGIPYVIISQKATDFKWPADVQRDFMRAAFSRAERCYFVSHHNLELTQLQMAQKLDNAEVVSNPFITVTAEKLAWPKPKDDRFKLACVARLFILEKGQDILIRVLAQKKWQLRNLEISFYGKGIHEQALKEMAESLGVNNVRFCGFTANITDVWNNHHGLVLSSRCEGQPLSVIEAMMCGRPVIVTNAGGTAEIVDDEVTGFIAKSADFHALDECLERAWHRRDEWESIGAAAASSIREKVPNDPCSVFANKLLESSTQVLSKP